MECLQLAVYPDVKNPTKRPGMQPTQSECHGCMHEMRSKSSIRNVSSVFCSHTLAVPLMLIRPFDKSMGGFRIVLIGDSVAQGYGVPRDSRFDDRLERALSGAVEHRRVEVINLARSGYATSQANFS